LSVIGQIEYNQYDFGSQNITGYYDGREYLLTLPLHIRPTLEYLRLRFEASNAYTPSSGDTRSLSTIFFQAKIEPDYSNFGVEGWLSTLWEPSLLAIICLSCWGIARLLGMPKKWALLLEATTGTILLAGLFIAPLALKPYLSAWSFILPIGWLLLWLAGLFSKRAPKLPAPFVYAATLYILIPLAQFAFLRLHLYSLNPSSLTSGVFTGALLFSAGMYNSHNLRPEDNSPDGLTVFERWFSRAMLAAAFISFLYNQIYTFQVDPFRGVEFRSHYVTLLNSQNGRNLYDLDRLLSQPSVAPRLPPFYAVLFLPLTQLFGTDQQIALQLWRVINLLLLVPTLIFLVRLFGQNSGKIHFRVPVLFLALSFSPVTDTIGFGQVNTIALLGLLLALQKLNEKRDVKAGLYLAIPSGLLLFPAALSFYFVLTKRWRGLVSLGVGFLGVGLLGLMVMGWDNFILYFRAIGIILTRPDTDISNQSIFGALARLSVPEITLSYRGDYPFWALLTGYICSFGLIAFTIKRLWQIRHEVESPSTARLLPGILILTGLIVAPIALMNNEMLALPALALLLQVLSNAKTPRWQLFVFGVCFGLLGYGNTYDFFPGEAVGLARLGASYRLAALLILWGLYLWLIKRQKEAENYYD
jgi:alpha-1,2-mannosyltransferase